MANNPEIKVGADLSGAEKAVEKFGKKLDEAAKPRKVDLDTAPAERALDDLGKKAQGADKATALPGAAVGIKNVAEELKKVGKLQADLAKAGIKASQDQAKAARDQFAKWRDSGARGTRRLKGQELEDFVGGGWRSAAMNEADARRHRNQVMQAVGLAGDRPGGRSLGEFARSALGRAGRGIGGQILPHGGIGGTIAQEGIAEGAGAGGLLSGAGLARMGAGLGIGALAFGAMKLVGGIKNSVGTAQDEGVDRSNLVRSVGGTVEEFNELRRSAQALAHGLDITAGEATSLARAYAAGAGVGQNDRGRIYGEAGQAGSFARQMGMDVGSTVGQFAELRRNGQDTPERLGKSIADAMSKRGDFGRLSEVLGGLTSFASSVTGSSLTKANTDGVLDIASRLAALKLPGMGTAEGVGHIAAMDAGFRGGAGGEAGDLMLLQGMQRRGLPANGYDVKSVREAGLFASMSDVFGTGSAPYKAAQAGGNGAEMSRLKRMSGAGGTTWDHVFADLQSRYSNPGELRSAVEAVTNGSAGDASALIAATRGGRLAGVTDKLNGMGIDTSRMNAAQMVQASGVLSASPAELLQRKQDMLARTGEDKLSKEDAESLRGAKDPEDLRRVIASVASKETIQTEGEKTRASMSSLQQVMENMANKIVPVLEFMRDALVKLAVKAGAVNQDDADRMMGIPPQVKLMKQRDALKAQIAEATEPSAFKDWWATDGTARSGHSIRMAHAAELQAQLGEVNKQIAVADAASGGGSAPAPVAAQAPAPKQVAAAEVGKKTAGDPPPSAFALSPAEQRASDAMEDSTVDVDIASVQRELANQKDPEVRQILQAELNKLQAKKRAKMARATDSGSGPLPGDAAPAAAGASSAAGGTVNHAHSVEITIKDPKGNRIAEVPPMPLHDGSPKPAGSGG